ncbi:hypothetical protein PR048_007827 [Dryococelus australis]|uniref:Uncharacterized protein n=1 Tax=Dryococelus australis TaxID=614101 RepID=A0ABQ9HW96_9NEOP|nr:hypothetical protein PR048_007827 [Dryococelus australis]
MVATKQLISVAKNSYHQVCYASEDTAGWSFKEEFICFAELDGFMQKICRNSLAWFFKDVQRWWVQAQESRIGYGSNILGQCISTAHTTDKICLLTI